MQPKNSVYSTHACEHIAPEGISKKEKARGVVQRQLNSLGNCQEDKKAQETVDSCSELLKRQHRAVLNAQLSPYPNFLPVKERHVRYII